MPREEISNSLNPGPHVAVVNRRPRQRAANRCVRRAAIYLRVSTADQAMTDEERELREIAGRSGLEIVQVYKDHGMSGTGRGKWGDFDALCRDASKKKFDVAMAWSVDQLSRSLQDLVAFLSKLRALGIDLFLHQQGLDTRTPAGKAMFQMMDVIGEFERSIVREGVRAGQVRAMARRGRPRIPQATEDAIRGALAKPGRPSLRKIAAKFGVNKGTVHRILKKCADK